MESTPKPAKNAGPDVSIWPPVASKCLLLYIRNDQSSYIEISAIHACVPTPCLVTSPPLKLL